MGRGAVDKLFLGNGLGDKTVSPSEISMAAPRQVFRSFQNIIPARGSSFGLSLTA